ncbi:hypothetical protein MUK42_13933 [Musa troglodytarum]|uniref:Uncharacterized protein n=1 Tax=Musa troglodytarum TaxID=320322 RepID=A0A9E7I814_9LILI|nr:hypothetical protein MUK42_13933 [Musa troglodytarum]
MDHLNVNGRHRSRGDASVTSLEPRGSGGPRTGILLDRYISPGFELLFLLIVYNLFRRTYESTEPGCSRPSSSILLDSWRKIAEDWTDWNKWMNNQGSFSALGLSSGMVGFFSPRADTRGPSPA